MTCMKAFILSGISAFLLFPISGIASSLEELPSSESSGQWEVLIDKPKNNDLDPKPDVYNIYSMDVKYIGDEDIKLDRVEVYREEFIFEQ